MCGIAGIIAVDKNEINLHRLKTMTDILAHRGPDGEGHWLSDNGHVGLGHRRLSIIDLSNGASQPMHYMGRYSLIFNGEIYNYIELKEILLKKGYSFSTSSDTEVLMAYYDWKKEGCLDALDGMFAFVLYDNKENKIFCSRDRFGEKPFYYYYKSGEAFYFASEMKGLWAAGLPKEINNSFIYNYITSGRIEDPLNPSATFYKNIVSLEQATCLTLDVESLQITIKKYWDIDINSKINNNPPDDIKSEFAFLMEESVSRRLRSDVTVGSSLSGGLDSSLIVCLINKLNSGRVQQNTFSARFPDFKKDEGKYMQLVIDSTNVSPHFIYPNENGLVEDFDKLMYHQEEPFGSSSIYAQYCVMQLAKENNVTVLLDGQGADEILAGYHSYFPVYFNELRRKNKEAYHAEKALYEEMFADSFNYTAEPNRFITLLQQHSPAAITKLKKWRENYREIKNQQFTNDFFSTYRNDFFKDLKPPDTLNGLLKQQTMVNLQQLLRFADRNSMAHSREVRLPFLSADLVSFLFSLPPSYKIKEGWTKWLMRTTFDSLLPKEIAWRKDKIGYEPPQYNWMENTSFKDMVMASANTLVKKGILNKKILEKPVIPHQVNDYANNYAWRYLIAGKMLT